MKTQHCQKQGTLNFINKSRVAFEEDFSTGKMLLGVIVKMPDGDENLYVCYEEKEKSWFGLGRVEFNDYMGCSRFNLDYAPIFV
jgi:hypothetical protein